MMEFFAEAINVKIKSAPESVVPRICPLVNGGKFAFKMLLIVPISLGTKNCPIKINKNNAMSKIRAVKPSPSRSSSRQKFFKNFSPKRLFFVAIAPPYFTRIRGSTHAEMMSDNNPPKRAKKPCNSINAVITV